MSKQIPETDSKDPQRREFLARAASGTVAAGAILSSAQPLLAQNTAAPKTATSPKGAAPPSAPNAAPRPLAAVGRPLPILEDEPPLPPEKRIGFAIVGLGKYALNQIVPSFADTKKAKLVALVSGNAAKAQDVAARHGIAPGSVYSYATMDRLRDNPAVDVIYIILPVGLHAEYVVRAARLGKHVMCEKPMAPTEKECQDMIAACRAANRKLMIGYRAQYEPFNLEAIRLARSKELGNIVSINADHGRQADPSEPSDQWRLQKALAGGGSLFDIGIYSLNATRYLTGEEPIEISAMIHSPAGDPRFREVESDVHWTLRFPSGVLANCSSSYNFQDTKRYRVQCERGWFELDPATDYYKHNLRIGRKMGDSTSIEMPQIAEKSQFAAELDHFADCIINNKNPKTPGEEGLRDVRLMRAIYQAAQLGRTVKV